MELELSRFYSKSSTTRASASWRHPTLASKANLCLNGSNCARDFTASQRASAIPELPRGFTRHLASKPSCSHGQCLACTTKKLIGVFKEPSTRRNATLLGVARLAYGIEKCAKDAHSQSTLPHEPRL